VRKTGNGDFSTFSPEYLVEGSRFLRRWPGSLDELVTERAKATNGGNTKLLAALRKYHSRDSPDTPIRELLRSRLPLLLFEANAPMKVFRNGRSAWLPPDTILATDAAKSFGMSGKTLRRLESHGHCVRARQKGRKKGGAALYDTAMLKNSIEVFRDAMNASDCGRALGIPPHCVPNLSDFGYVDRIRDHDANLLADEPIFQRRSFEALLTKLEQINISVGMPGTSLADALNQNLDPQIWADALSLIFSGTLPVMRRDGPEKPVFERLFTDHLNIRKFLCSVPQRELPKDVFVTGETAAKSLKISDVIISGAVKAGLILAEKASARRIDISLYDLGQFRSGYITSTEGGQKLGVAGFVFGKEMVARGFSRVGKVYGCSIWKRQDAEQLFLAGYCACAKAA
jgi:hypothetical protein